MIGSDRLETVRSLIQETSASVTLFAPIYWIGRRAMAPIPSSPTGQTAAWNPYETQSGYSALITDSCLQHSVQGPRIRFSCPTNCLQALGNIWRVHISELYQYIYIYFAKMKLLPKTGEDRARAYTFELFRSEVYQFLYCDTTSIEQIYI